MLRRTLTNRRPASRAANNVRTSIGWLLVAGCLLACGGAKKAVVPARQARADALAAQWRPDLNTELAFIRHLFPDLAPAKRVVVKGCGEQALIVAAEVAAGFSTTANRSNYRGSTRQTIIREALSEALRETLSADEWQHFEDEAAARIKRRQETAILLVVERLDEVLYLTPEQRDQISRLLADRWQNAWEDWLQLRHAQGVPMLPADIVLTYLDADQKKVWQNVPKVAITTNSIHVVRDGNVAVDNATWWDEGVIMDDAADADVPAP